MKLVVESGGQQQIDPIDTELFAWAQRVAASKYTESTKAEVFAGMLEVAIDNNLFDHEIYFLYNEIEDVLEKLPFIDNLLRYANGYNETVMPSVVDLMKYYKFKVDLEKYNLRIDDEIVEELSENLIQELVN